MQDINPETGSGLGLAATAAPMAEHTPGNEFTVVANWELFGRTPWACAMIPLRFDRTRQSWCFPVQLTNPYGMVHGFVSTRVTTNTRHMVDKGQG